MNSLSSIMTPGRPADGRHSVLTHLLAYEWAASSRIFGLLGLGWFCGLWILVLFHHPAWLLLPAGMCVIMTTPARAGADVLDGTEEFSFSLPPGRGPLFLSRVIPGMVFILATGLIGGAAIALDLPQMLWSLVFSGPMTEPFAPVKDRQWYFLAVLYPLAAHACTFVTASMTTSRTMVMLSWLLGGLAAVLTGGAATLFESVIWSGPTGLLAIPALLTLTVSVLLGGYRAYLGKEATRSSGTATSGMPKLLVILAAIALLLLLLSLFWFRAADVSTRSEAAKRSATELSMKHAAAMARERAAESKPKPLNPPSP